MLRIGNVNLASNLLLAPIAGYCDLAFRLVVRTVPGVPRDPNLDPNRDPDPTALGEPASAGGRTAPNLDPSPPTTPPTAHPTLGLACTDLLCPQAVLSENDKSLWLAATCPEDSPVAMQLYGRHVEALRPAAEWAVQHGAAVVDLNMGCPVDKVTKKNGGSKLLTEPCLAIDIIENLVRTLEPTGVPVTAKIRLGWDDDSIITQTLPVALADRGVAAVTVHGRTTAMKFKGECRHEGIAEVVESVKARHPHVAVIGNGDVKTPQDAKRMLDATGCDGVMVGRGALGQPWLFRDAAAYLATGQLPEPYPRLDRARCVLHHFDNLLRFRDERIALATIKRRMSWYSRHLQPWPGLRRDVQDLPTATAFRDFMHRGMDRIERDEGQAWHEREGSHPEPTQPAPSEAALSTV